MANDYLAELEKIANEILDDQDPMTEDLSPSVPPEEVERIQASNEDLTSDSTDALSPTSPDDMEALNASVEQAEADLHAAKEVLAGLEDDEEFEKVASEVRDSLPFYGALATLIDYASNADEEDPFHKLARERLTEAMQDEESYQGVIERTASELFDTEANLKQLHSPEGLEYVAEHLASFAEDEELEKFAFEIGGLVNAARVTVSRAADNIKRFYKIDEEISQAKAEIDKLKKIVTEKDSNIRAAKQVGNEPLVDQYRGEYLETSRDLANANQDLLNSESFRTKGRVIGVGTAAGLASGSALLGKKMYDAHQNDPSEELSQKTASDTMNQEEIVNYNKGGTNEMSQSIVKDFLKIAGAAALIEIANNEEAADEHRKMASERFDSIAMMGRSAIEENLEKVAYEVYEENELHEIVAGKHNEELFKKVAFFVDAVEMSFDELEKVAGNAGTVAAKGVGGALSDAKKNIEEHVKGDKEKVETIANGEIGSKKADDMRGYNVINNPGTYEVDKTAAVSKMIEEAELRKEAAYKEYIEADLFIKNNS